MVNKLEDNRFPLDNHNTVKDRNTLQGLLSKETFAGVKELIENREDGKNKSYILIIKNIKSFNHVVLNELIHLLKKYRQSTLSEDGTTDGLNLCLILGVQNNNRDEVHLRLNIQSCAKLTLKTFYFPSMKNIIFQVIDKALITTKSPSKLMMPLTFSQKTIENLIETINLYGMSVEKFKRTLQLILVENMFTNSYYFVHLACFPEDTPAYSESRFEKKALLAHKWGQNGLVEIFVRGLKRYDTALQKPIKSDQHYKIKAEEIFD